MDSGDKATNKAMSIAMKYAMFQLFMIPTEAVDPDGECHEVDPIGQQVNRPKTGANGANVAVEQRVPAPVSKAPEAAPAQPETPGAYIKRRIVEFTAKDKNFNFVAARQALIEGGVVEDVPSAIIKMPQAVALMDAIEKNFFAKAG